ncbi:phospholipase A2 inhibitor and Ly6/PLAUR domain-containing protein-like [Thamnophis elegans]|uniref:phospholipase A2 inhibitor and Ly6/PLAUR domain-containing protein-like n=1 Tax=Thamnophis elegans TaxID=35005 RepID=UPI00137872B6|nr:phospholipase A2 inhibitor and Ly6/PLAUR domain-containing protein-like [Thamnophis elegans]
MQTKFLDIHSHGGITKTAPSLLQIFLFFEFLKTVATLQCEVCSGLGTNCTGRLKTCEPEQETCAVILIRNSLGERVVDTVAKGCESNVICDFPTTHLNMGIGKILQGNVCKVVYKSKCCCYCYLGIFSPFPLLFSVPSVATNANGRRCPACYSERGTCEKKLTNCTGNEQYCFHLFMRSYGGEFSFPCRGGWEIPLMTGDKHGKSGFQAGQMNILAYCKFSRSGVVTERWSSDLKNRRL